MNTQEIGTQNLIYKCRSGSHAYGTNLPTSDIDTRGIFIAPKEYIITCINNIEQVEFSQEDTVLYELRKFMKLAGDCNPNIIEILNVDTKDILFMNDIGQELRRNTSIFLSKKARFTFSGYAMSQLKRIKGHKKWINNPKPKDPPHIKDYCAIIKNDGSFTQDVESYMVGYGAFLVPSMQKTHYRVYANKQLLNKKYIPFYDNKGENLQYQDSGPQQLKDKHYLGLLIVNYDHFQKDIKEWKQYWDWKNHRNQTRSLIEEKYGYDCKHAMHLVRLMKMCQEILQNGQVNVFRNDAKDLLDIRNGKFSHDELIEWAEDMDKSLDSLYEKSKLPHSPNWKQIDCLYRQLANTHWRLK